MTVAFVTHFVETTPGFCVSESSFANIGGKIVHTGRADTGDFTRLAIYVDFLFWVCGWFHYDADFLRHFPRIIRDAILLHGCVVYMMRI